MAVDARVMQMRPFGLVTSNNWVDLHVAAEYAGVHIGTLVLAITERKIRSVTSHPDRPGDWRVPLADVDHWCRRGESPQAVYG